MKQRSFVVCLCALSLSIAIGCRTRTSNSADDAAGDDAADSAAQGFDVESDRPTPVCDPGTAAVLGATCNDVTAAGPCVEQTQIDDSAPAPTGGVLVAGTYDLVEVVVFTNPGGATGPTAEPLRQTFLLAGDGTNWTLNGGTISGMITSRQTVTITLSPGSQLRFSPSCPSDADGGVSWIAATHYSASDQTFTLYELKPNGPVRAQTYTRR